MAEHEYDDAGRIVRTVTSREPEYTELDRGELLALAMFRTWLCPCGCGFLTKDTHVMEGTPGAPKFEASAAGCNAALALIEAQRAEDNKYGDKPNPYARALVWRIQMSRG